jgi:polyphosphate kinase
LGEDVFSVLQQGEVLVHHPYESFAGSVLRLIEDASVDPQVVAIKQTLHGTTGDSPIVRALLRAAEQGKQVAVLLGAEAPFDARNGVDRARMLEHSGVHVTYGLTGLETHAQVLIVIRNEEGKPRAYCHVGSGRYDEQDAKARADVGILTCDPVIGTDLVSFFHFLTGLAPAQRYRRLIVAPGGMRAAFVDLIRREASSARQGKGGRILAKMNTLDDVDVIRELYAASAAGVGVDLIVRGHCGLRPGLRGVSENIRVVSVIGRFLEHERIFHFGNGGKPAIYIGSADWSSRSFDERVEVVVPVMGRSPSARLTRILGLSLRDNRLAWNLGPDGQYEKRVPVEGEMPLNLQAQLRADALRRNLIGVHGGTKRFRRLDSRT